MINALATNAIKILKLMIFKIFYGFYGSKRKFKLHLELFGNWRDIARVNFKCIIWVFGVPWVVWKFKKLKTQKSPTLMPSIDRIFKCRTLRLTYNIAEDIWKLPRGKTFLPPQGRHRNSATEMRNDICCRQFEYVEKVTNI